MKAQRFLSTIMPASLFMLSACVHFTPTSQTYSSVESIPKARGITRSGQPALREAVVYDALAVVDTPYHYGGSSPETGFDCSGLVSYIYMRAGLRAPRTVAEQARLSAPIDWTQLEPGDLVFFQSRGQVFHVGIYLGNGNMIHAPASGGKVRVESLTGTYWRQHFSGGSRIEQYAVNQR